MYLNFTVYLDELEDLNGDICNIEEFVPKEVKRLQYGLLRDILSGYPASSSYLGNVPQKNSVLKKFCNSCGYDFDIYLPLVMENLRILPKSNPNILFHFQIDKKNKEQYNFLKRFQKFLGKIYPILNIKLINNSDYIFEDLPSQYHINQEKYLNELSISLKNIYDFPFHVKIPLGNHLLYLHNKKPFYNLIELGNDIFSDSLYSGEISFQYKDNYSCNVIINTANKIK